MKDGILELIPKSETKLRKDIAKAKDNNELLSVLLRSFGINARLWTDWQKKVEKVYQDGMV